VYEILDKYQLDYTIDWTFNGLPFLTESGTLVDATVAAIKHVTGRDTELSTAGGTSDGRFIAPTGAQVIELGPINSTIHQIDERVKADDLVQLADMYYHILVNTLGNE
jgi:succinyl-diaminopimelate desuccinylase